MIDRVACGKLGVAVTAAILVTRPRVALADPPAATAVVSTSTSAPTSNLVFYVGVCVFVGLAVVLLRHRGDRRIELPRRARRSPIGRPAGDGGSLEPTQLMEQATADAVRLTSSLRGAYLAAGDGSPRVVHASVAGTIDPDRLGRGIVAKALETGQASRAITNEAAFGPGVVAAMAVPVSVDEMVVGVLAVVRGADEPYTIDELGSLTTLGTHVAASLAAAYRREPATIDGAEPAPTSDVVVDRSSGGPANCDAASDDDAAAALDRRRDVPAPSMTSALARITEPHAEDPPSLAIVLIDVDHLSAVRERGGQVETDRLLTAVAEVLQAHVRGGDRVERDRPDGFRILLVQATADEAAEVCERLRGAVEVKVFAEGAQFPAGRVTVSVGVALADHDDLARVQLRADEALQEAKQTGRNRVVLVGC